MKVVRWGMFICALATLAGTSWAKTPTPGSGRRVVRVGDDFEDPKWVYNFNLPKSSYENDDQQRLPAGASANGRWYEGVKRGQPDVIRRVPTPEGGIPGSEGALLMVSRHTGIPGAYSGTTQQDDLIVDVRSRLGASVSVSQSPNIVVRVFLPPWEEWEKRTGNTFGFRAACQAYKTSQGKRGWFGGGGSTTKLEEYWPGMFIFYNGADAKTKQHSVTLILRAGPQGQDFWGPKITETGWWTFGMSFTPDGQVHYYAHAGVEDLSDEDHISSQFPYGMRCEQLDAFFFDIVNADNGSWSTPWIIDDPMLFYGR